MLHGWNDLSKASMDTYSGTEGFRNSNKIGVAPVLKPVERRPKIGVAPVLEPVERRPKRFWQGFMIFFQLLAAKAGSTGS
jgi:hypothetical protein